MSSGLPAAVSKTRYLKLLPSGVDIAIQSQQHRKRNSTATHTSTLMTATTYNNSTSGVSSENHGNVVEAQTMQEYWNINLPPVYTTCIQLPMRSQIEYFTSRLMLGPQYALNTMKTALETILMPFYYPFQHLLKCGMLKLCLDKSY